MDVKLKELRDMAGLTLMDISRRTKISQTKLSLAENGLATLSAVEEASIRAAIVDVSTVRTAKVLEAAKDNGFNAALAMIESDPQLRARFKRNQERYGFSPLEAAVQVLGRDYPVRG